MKPRSTRLNKSNRDDFIKKVVKKYYPPEKRPDINDFKRKWNPKIYDIIFSPYKEQLDALPDSWLASTRKIWATINGTTLEFESPKDIKRPGTGDGGYYSSTKFVPIVSDEHQISKEYKQHCNDLRDFNAKKNSFESQIRTLAYSCNTSAQLFKAWPEAEHYSECFPYVGPERHAGAAISKTEIDLGKKLANLKVKLPNEN